MDSQADRRGHKQADRVRNRQTNRNTTRQTDGDTNRQTDRESSAHFAVIPAGCPIEDHIARLIKRRPPVGALCADCVVYATSHHIIFSIYLHQPKEIRRNGVGWDGRWGKGKKGEGMEGWTKGGREGELLDVSVLRPVNREVT